MAEIMCGRVIKRNSPAMMSGESASGMSMMGGNMGSMGGMMGGSQGADASELGKKLQAQAEAAAAANKPQAVRPSWRSY